jgi:hypothetical protein
MPIPDDSSTLKEEDDSIDSSDIDIEINRPIEEEKTPTAEREETKQKKRVAKAEYKNGLVMVERIESDSPRDTMTHQGKKISY